ncbi:hypothetical protein K5549_021535, partial [Capra hircus]
SAIQNLNSFDPFVDASKGDDLHPVGTEDYIHIRIQQRNGRKTLLQGDQRKNICQFLVEIALTKDDQLKVHGF